MLGQSYPLGSSTIYPYWVCFDLAFILGGLYLVLALRPYGVRAWKIIVLLCVVFATGLAGARLFSLLESHTPLNRFWSPREGLTFYGGLLTSLLIIPPFAAVAKIPLARLLDKGALSIAFGYGIGRVGCFLTGDGCYGVPSSLPWAMTFPHGDPPVYVPVHPAPLYETALSFIVFATCFWYFKHRGSDARPGVCFLVVMGLLALSRFVVETVRLNPRYYGLSQAQWISVGIVFCAIMACASLSRIFGNGSSREFQRRSAVARN
jgi:phosphatidylglycerol:prolipoprotein diacylglycerol transferase